MKTRLSWMSAGTLALLLAGQLVTHGSQAPALAMHASWAFHPHTLTEALTRAQATVLVQVVAVQSGADIVTPAKAEPNGEDRIPTQQITVRVLRSYKGTAKAGDTLTLFQTGGAPRQAAPAAGTKESLGTAPQVVLEGDPLYQQGEMDLLMLEQGPGTMLRSISPEGRYLVDPSGALVPMVDNDVTRQLVGKHLAAIDKVLAQP